MNVGFLETPGPAEDEFIYRLRGWKVSCILVGINRELKIITKDFLTWRKSRLFECCEEVFYYFNLTFSSL